MIETYTECIRCDTPLKKQVIGSNEVYYCNKCGAMSSVAQMSVPEKVQING